MRLFRKSRKARIVVISIFGLVSLCCVSMLFSDTDSSKPTVSPSSPTQAEVKLNPSATKKPTSVILPSKTATLVTVKVNSTPAPLAQPTDTRWPTATSLTTKVAAPTRLPTATNEPAVRSSSIGSGLSPTNSGSSGSVNCSSDKDCGNFSSCSEFQSFLDACNYNRINDWMGFDGNKDGQPCETLCGGWSW